MTHVEVLLARQRSIESKFRKRPDSLIGLPKKGTGDTLRPAFSDTTVPEGDVAVHQNQFLWANLYSRTGYKEMIDRGEVEREGRSRFKLTATFQEAFEKNLPEKFRFEELRVWLFAFREIPDGVASWQELWAHFRDQFLGGEDIPQEYKGRFRIRSGTAAVPWPTQFLNQRPKNTEYQQILLPSEFVEPLTCDVWKEIDEKLFELAKRRYRGLTEEEISQMCKDVVIGLMAAKRVFLLGDPGVGKSELSVVRVFGTASSAN